MLGILCLLPMGNGPKARWVRGAGSWGVFLIFVDATNVATCRQIMQNRVPELSRRRIHRGTFNSVGELARAIEEHIAINNAHPKPFEWHACADLILAKVAHCKEALGAEH
jgi:hypothetical protein